MKNYISTFILCFLAQLIFADNNRAVVPSQLKEVTVYKSQARLTHEADYTIPVGTTELVIDNISNNIIPATLQVFIKGKVELISAAYNNDYINTAKVNPKVLAWQDSVEVLNDKLNLLNAEKQVYEEEQELLKQNRSLGNEKTPFTANDVQTLADMYRKRAMELKEKVLNTAKVIKQITERRDKIQSQIIEFNAVKNRPTGQIVLTLYTTQPLTGSVRCSYTATSAGWTPQYDLRSEGFGAPVTLVQKADIKQNTGLDWAEVKLTISTGNPALNNSRPILNPLYVNYTEYVPTQDFIYKIDMKRGGYESPASSMNMALEEKKNKDDGGYIDPYLLGMTLSDNTVNVIYELTVPQNVPTDGKTHTIQYDKQEIAASYIYHAVPRLEPTAFLLAKIPDWGKYNLMAGTANIFLQGNYVGQSIINPNVTSDTLLLSFGRDERITMKRNKITELCETKCIGSNKTDKYVYDIVIKNTKQQSIDIEILDQLPISKQDDIKVELQNGSGAVYNAEIGKLEWKITLGPGQNQKLRLEYTVKYPKNKNVFEAN